MSKVLIVLLCLVIAFWWVPQINQVSAEPPTCTSQGINPSVWYMLNGSWVEVKDNAPVPQSTQNLYFEFESANSNLEGKTFRLYIQWHQANSLGVPGAPSTEGQFSGGRLELATNKPELLRNTPSNAIYGTYLQQQDSSGKYTNNPEETAFCKGMSYKVGYAYNYNNCKIAFSTDPGNPVTGQTIIANISDAPDGTYSVATRGFKDSNLQKQGVTIDKYGHGKITFQAPTNPIVNAELSLWYMPPGENIPPVSFCTKRFNIDLATQPLESKCIISPSLTPSILEEISVTATNVQPGKNYYVRRINKANGQKEDFPKEAFGTAAKDDGTVQLWLNEPTRNLPIGKYAAEVYGFPEILLQCTSKDFTVGSPIEQITTKKCGDTDEKGNKIVCSTGGGIPCGDASDLRGPAFKTAIGCIHTNPAELVKDLMTWVIGIGGGLAFLMMLLGAFQVLTSAGNPETLNAGKDRLTNAAIGLLFIIFTILLLQIIGVGILNLPGFGK